MVTPLFSPFDIQRIDPFSDEMEEFTRVMNACMLEEWGNFAQRVSIEDFRAEARTLRPQPQFFMIRVGERPAAVGKVEFHNGDDDNPATGEAYGIARVLKAVSGYGIGLNMITHLEEVTAQLGYPVLYGITSARSYRDDRVTRIMERLGYEQRTLEIRQDFDSQTGQSVARTPLADGYTAVLEVNGLSQQQADGIAELDHRAMEELYGEESRMTGDEILHHVRGAIEGGRQTVFAVITHDETGEIIGFNESSFRVGDAFGEFGNAYVRVDHRGKKLEQWLAAEVAQALLDGENAPDKIRAFQPTDHTNMITGLREAGFRNTAYTREWIKPLKPTSDQQQ